MTTPDTTPGATPPNKASQLISRAVLFGDPDRIDPQLSPDGTLLAYAAPHEGVMNVFVEPVDGSAPARPVTADRGHGITEFMLCAGNRLVYAQDTDGDEKWRLYVVDLSDGKTRLVAPERGVSARLVGYWPSWHPDQMLIALNADDPRFPTPPRPVPGAEPPLDKSAARPAPAPRMPAVRPRPVANPVEEVSRTYDWRPW